MADKLYKIRKIKWKRTVDENDDGSFDISFQPRQNLLPGYFYINKNTKEKPAKACYIWNESTTDYEEFKTVKAAKDWCQHQFESKALEFLQRVRPAPVYAAPVKEASQ